ncbi:hypothetical protein HT031_003751 [Scenedesmus sp. PABB004]|nr:hypothetical protein HT031_003751 [Scenedesmus sp. PABB004]
MAHVAVSGGVALMQLCASVYLKYKNVKRYRDDCKKLASFVRRVEGFLMETEDEVDMDAPGWQAAFSALHEALLEVGDVFDDCARFGIVRSLINADDINLRLNSIAQRLCMALSLVPIQKAKVTGARLAELSAIQVDIRAATFCAVRAAEEQSAALKRLMDQSRVDAGKSQEMLAQVLALLQQDAAARGGCGGGAAAAAAPAGAGGDDAGDAGLAAALAAEVEDLRQEMAAAHRDKRVLEEAYVAQIIAAIEAMEVAALEGEPGGGADGVGAEEEACDAPPPDLLCPITCQLLEDPVLLVSSGQTYERVAIAEWLSRGNAKDPATGTHLESAALVPNVLVRKLAAEWLAAHPGWRRRTAAAAAAAAQYGTPRGGGGGGRGGDVGDGGCATAKASGGLQECSSADLEPHPKAAALLAAAGGGALPELLAASGSVDEQKEAAHRAYAAAVAAEAARAGSEEAVPALPLAAAPWRGARRPPEEAEPAPAAHWPAGSGGGGSGLAAGGPFQTWGGADPRSVKQPQQQQQPQQQLAPLVGFQQQLAPLVGFQQQQQSPHGSAGASPRGLPAGAAGGVTLSRYRATFGRLAAARAELTARHGTPLERIEETRRRERDAAAAEAAQRAELAARIAVIEQSFRAQGALAQEPAPPQQQPQQESPRGPAPPREVQQQHHQQLQESAQQPQQELPRWMVPPPQQHHQQPQQESPRWLAPPQQQQQQPQQPQQQDLPRWMVPPPQQPPEQRQQHQHQQLQPVLLPSVDSGASSVASLPESLAQWGPAAPHSPGAFHAQLAMHAGRPGPAAGEGSADAAHGAWPAQPAGGGPRPAGPPGRASPGRASPGRASGSIYSSTSMPATLPGDMAAALPPATPSAWPPRGGSVPVPAAAPPPPSSTRSSGSAASAPVSRAGGWAAGLLGRARARRESGTGSGAGDDAASVSSDGSSASRRLVMRSVLKSLSYTLVYEDDKC